MPSERWDRRDLQGQKEKEEKKTKNPIYHKYQEVTWRIKVDLSSKFHWQLTNPRIHPGYSVPRLASSPQRHTRRAEAVAPNTMVLLPFPLSPSPIIEKWNVPRIPNSPRERWLGPCGPDVWCQRWMNLASFQPSEGFYFPFPGTYSFRWFLWLDDSSLFSSPSTTCYCCKYVVVLSCLWPRFSSEFAQVLVGHQ